jgi:hypothetical protein
MKTHKHYNVGDMFVYDLPEGSEPHTKVIYYISEKTRSHEKDRYEYKLTRIDQEAKWPLYYRTGELNNNLVSCGYKHIPVVK